jgi:hypothetical protein
MSFGWRLSTAMLGPHRDPREVPGDSNSFSLRAGTAQMFCIVVLRGIILAFLFLPSGAALPKSQALPRPIRCIAHRYDDVRVVFSLDRTFPDEAELRRRSLTQNPTRLKDPVAKLAGMTLWKMDEEFWRRHLGQFRLPSPGDRLVLKTGGATTLHCTVERLAIAETSCGTSVVAIALVDANEQETFRQVKEMHYLVLDDTGNSSASLTRTGPPFSIETPLLAADEKGRLEDVLQEQLQRELPRVRRSSESSYALLSQLRQLNPWPARDRLLAQGAGKLSYDIQALRLIPNGQLLYYVRAHWTVEQETVFLMSVWMRADWSLVPDSVNIQPSLWLRMNEFQSEKLGLEDLGILLNVFDYDQDGWGEILVARRGRQGYQMRLLEYSERQGFRRTGIAYRYGC